MILKRLQIYSFMVVLGLCTVLLLWMFKSLFTIIAFAMILTIIFWPLRSFLFHWTGSEAKAAWLTFGIVCSILLIILGFVSTVIVRELTTALSGFSIASIHVPDSALSIFPESIRTQVTNFFAGIDEILLRSASGAFNFIQSILSNAASFVFSLVLLLFSLYYLLRDGHKLTEVIKDISPIAEGQEEKLFDKIILAVNGVVKGTFLIGLVQGLVATIGFLIFGVPNPLLLGMLTVVTSFIPTFGTSIIILPSVVYLFLIGDVFSAIGLAIWGLVAVGLIDNFIAPKILSGKTNIHPLLVFFSVLGGLEMFGVLGVLLGPIIVAIFLALLDIYRSDIKKVVEN